MTHLRITGRRAGALALAFLLPTIEAARAEKLVFPDPLSLEWCLERAGDANPKIAEVAAAAAAARERVVPAGALEDPRLGYEASNIPIGDYDFNSTPLSGHQLGLRQKLPFPGLLSSREDAARAGYEASQLEVDNRRLLVAAAVEAAWANLGFAQRALAITRRNIELLRQLAAVAEAKYRVGEGLQQDVLRAQVELTSLLEAELRGEAAVISAEAHLAELLDLDPGRRLPDTSPLDDPSDLPDVQGLFTSLEEQSPHLRALEARIEQADERVRGARLEGYPDFDVGVGYRVRSSVTGDPVDGDDFLSAGVTIRLPVDRRKWRARVAEAHAETRRVEAEYRGALASLRTRVRSAHAELVRADSEVQLVDTGLVPQARQSLESSRSGYEVGRIDFLSLLDSQLSLLRAELRRVRAVADRRVAFATLEAAAGEKLR